MLFRSRVRPGALAVEAEKVDIPRTIDRSGRRLAGAVTMVSHSSPRELPASEDVAGCCVPGPPESVIRLLEGDSARARGGHSGVTGDSH